MRPEPASARALRLRETVLAYKRAFDGAEPALRAHWFVRLVVRLGLAGFARFALADQTWLAIVLADLERFCHARWDQTTHEYSAKDPHGRDTAQLEGRRLVYLRIAGRVALTPAEIDLMIAADLEEQREIQTDAS